MEGQSGTSTASIVLAGQASEIPTACNVQGAGDLDGDGQLDLVVGEWRAQQDEGFHSGRASLVLGPFRSAADLESAEGSWWGASDLDYAGYSVAGAGDVDGDGLDDVLVGAHGVDEAGSASGAAYLLLGPATGSHGLDEAAATLLGQQAGELAGREVAAAGDFDGDSYPDLLVGAPGEGSVGVGAGAVYLVLGPVSGSLELGSADLQILPEAGGDQLGAALSPGADLDGDGLSDLLLGAPNNDTGGSDAGAAYLVLGRDL